MLYNRGVNDTLSDLVLPPLDLTTSESVVLSFSSHYSFADAWESIGVLPSLIRMVDQAWFRLTQEAGTTVPVELLRGGKPQTVRLPVVD